MSESPTGIDQSLTQVEVRWPDNTPGVAVTTASADGKHPQDGQQPEDKRSSGSKRMGKSRPLDEKDMSLVERVHKHGEDAAALISEQHGK